MKTHHFDVVVVGAGAAGCAAAGRLVERGARVCLVEAGPDYGPRTSGRWPPDLLDPHRAPDTHDWGYAEVSLARVIGGCSAHNYCAALWGAPDDYDGWAKAGNRGWAYEQLRPLMAQVEKAASVHPYNVEELASMGPRSDAAAVVNAVGQVRGSGNLFVADASIIPVIPQAPTNLTSMLIGLKVAESVANPNS